MFCLSKLKITVVGLGYVGLPLALSLGNHFDLTGFDIDGMRIAELMKGVDRNAESSANDILQSSCFFTDDKEKSWKEKTVKIRYLPDSKRTPCMIDICGSLIVNLIPQENTIQTIVIRNQNLADTFKTFFEEIWKIAKE